jgi:hypothetical protein
MGKTAYFGKDSITPDFLRSVEKSAEKFTYKKEEKDNESEINQARENEAKTSSFNYTGHGKTLEEKFKVNHKKNNLGRIKKGAPTFAIAGFIIAAVFFMFTMVGNLGNQIETLITRATDTMFGSYSENSIRITEELLAGKRGEFPEYFENRLKDQGIAVSGSESAGYTLDWSGIAINSGSFREVYSNDVNFREAFTKAKRGRTSNFFDMSASFAFTRLGVSRNLYRKYQQTGDSDADKKAYRKTESDLFYNSTHASMNTVTDRQATDEDGNPKIDDDGNPVMERVKSGDDISSSQGGDSRVKARGYITDIAGRVADTTSTACAALKVANMISVTVAAAEVYQAIHYFLSNAENFSKTKAGDGNNAAQNYVLNMLNEPVTATYVDAETGEEKEVTGAPIEAEGFSNVLAGTTPDLKKTRNYSVESAFLTSSFAIGLTAANHKICGGLRAVGAVASIAIGVMGGGIVSSIATLAKSTAINFALQQGIMAILSVLIPKVAMALFENTADSLMGIPAGETFVKGAALGNKKVARSSSGQALASKEVATAYSREMQIANNYESELGRKNRSPFDASSPDTFIGQIATKFGVVISQNSVVSSISKISNIAGNTFASLLGASATNTFANSITDPDYTVDYELAGDDYSTIFAEDQTCQYLTDIGASCGMYGEEVTATHPDVMKISSDDPKYVEILEDNVEKQNDGTYKVIPNSFLANKIMYCDERDSPFGVYDSNIANAFETSLGFADNIPILNDVIDLLNAAEDMDPETEGWARGSFCVMNKETNPHFEELIYLQHFTEDQRIAVQMELEETRKEDGSISNPTIAYKEAWYEVNPIDTSTAGLLARYTGSTKKEAEDIIALVEYYDYLANYEPPKEEKEEYQLELNNPTLESVIANIMMPVEYADVRNRSYAA